MAQPSTNLAILQICSVFMSCNICLGRNGINFIQCPITLPAEFFMEGIDAYERSY